MNRIIEALLSDDALGSYLQNVTLEGFRDDIDELTTTKAVAVANPKKADIDDAFEVFWGAGMRKMKKTAKARPAFERAIPKGCSAMEFAEMLCRDVAERLRIGQFGFEGTHPASYLNGMGWEDELKAPAQQDVLTPLSDCFGATTAAAADDTLAFMRGITTKVELSGPGGEVQGQLTLEHQG